MRLPLERLLGFDNEIVYAHLFDNCTDTLGAPASDGKHVTDRGNSEDHAEHGEQRARAVEKEILRAKLCVARPLLGDGDDESPFFRSKDRHQGAPTVLADPEPDEPDLRATVGSRRAISVPSGRPSIMARVSLSPLIWTSRC